MFKKIAKLYKYFVIAITVLVMVIVNINVFYRYVLNSSLGWASELSRFIFIWITFCGAVLAYDREEHIGLDFFVNLLPSAKLQTIVSLVGDLLVVILLVTLLKTGITGSLMANNTSPALGIVMGKVYMAVPIGASCMLLLAVKKIIRKIKKLWQADDLMQEEEANLES